MASAQAAARKFWEAVPMVMRAVFSEARKSGHNLSPNHFRILRVLSHRSCNLSELAEHQDVSLPTMSASVQTLVERGWLERTNALDDRRVTQLRLTRKGQQVLVNEHKRLVGWVADRMNKLEPGEVEQIEQGLNLLLSLFDNPGITTLENKQESVKRKASRTYG